MGWEDGVRHSPALSGPPIPAPAARPQLARESREPWGWGGGAGGKKDPQGSQREGKLGATTFSGQKLGAQGLAPTRPPGVPHSRECPAAPGGERRPGQGKTEALTWTRLGTPWENFRRGWREAGERGPARARHLAPRIPRPAPRAPNLACVLSRLHRPRSWKVGVPLRGGGGALLQPAPGSASRGPGSNPAGRLRLRPRDWGSGAPPSSPPLRPSRPLSRPPAFIRPYRVESASFPVFL